MKTEKRLKSPALQYAYDQFVASDPERVRSFDDELANASIARQVYDLRKEAGLTQRELAKRVGTTASVICRLEDADYQGHSISMLRRVAAALDKRVEVRIVELEGRKRRLRRK
jgi:DNA-binding XRE family transcriptional regulator